MTRSILEVTARWREDQPGGFAVNVTFETPKLGEHFAKQLLVAIEGLDHDKRWSPDVALRHLSDVGRMPETSRDETIRRRAVGIVAWLQERGHLVADEHNGVAWHRLGQTSEVIVEAPRIQALSEPTLKAAKKSVRPRAAASRERARPAAAKKKARKARKKD